MQDTRAGRKRVRKPAWDTGRGRVNTNSYFPEQKLRTD